ncbi:MAG TPA: homoaconitate hydratase [Actinobacteria bacterium]|jgi:homocitrate synthase NifV|nr:homoaconitate hydratase [Actinomycetota bacterium]
MAAEINNRKINIMDSTLRSGEQTPGVVFSKNEKIRIAKMLDEIGVPDLEVGVPTLASSERDTIREILNLNLSSRIFGYLEALPSNISYVRECGLKNIVITVYTSEGQIKEKYNKSKNLLISRLKDTIREIKKHNIDFIISAEDGTRADLKLLLQIINIAKSKGALRVRICDSVGADDPFKTFLRINTILSTVDFPIEVHTKNNFGMATANGLAAIRAGASSIMTSVNGLAEGTGNAALEEIVMALKYLENIDLGINTSRFREISEYLAKSSSRAIPVWKAIVGTNVFAHESGIHADGVLKNPRNYEVFEPAEVGLTRQLVVGKHSGSHTILHKFKEFGIDLTDIEANEILVLTRAMSVDLKRTLFDKELMYIYKDYRESKKNQEITDDSDNID